jgi:hypothetical protein
MTSMDVLIAAAVPEQALTGWAALAVICGVVLLGGRQVVGVPLHLLRKLRKRSARGEPEALPEASGEQALSELDFSATIPMRRVEIPLPTGQFHRAA